MFGFIADIIASATTILLPCYLSYKSLRSGDPAQTTPWLIYFIMLSLALLFESWTLFIIGWAPFYSWIRLFFLLYMVLPQTQGAKHLYLTYFEPFIVDHERQIDEFIGEMHHRLEQMGLGYMNFIVEWIRDKVLGQASPQQPVPSSLAAGGGAAGYASYAQDLLSRFAMPAARTNAAPAVTSSGGMLNMLSGVAGAALSGSSSMSGTSRSMPPSAEAASIPDSYIPAALAQLSGRDRSAFISTQRERLSVMQKALDKEQQSLDLAYGSGPGPASGNKQRPSSRGSGVGLGSKSRSEQSFDKIEYDDVHSTGGSGNGSGYPSQHSTPPKGENHGNRATSGGWVPAGLGGWLGGGGGGSGGNTRDTDRYDEDDRRKSGPGPGSKGWSTARDITESIARSTMKGSDDG